MSEKIKCEICEKEFSSKESLEQHAKDKHILKNDSKPNPANYKKIRNWIIFLAICGVLIFVAGYIISGALKKEELCKNLPANEINIGGHQNLELHIHADLEIIINGTKQEIPANIGIFNDVMRPVHTHDSSGEIHIEGPCKRDFSLGDFFKIWGREFNSQKIFDKTTENGDLKMYVNEKENEEFENLILKDDQNIRIEYIPKNI